MPGNSVCPETGYWLLPHPDLYPKYPDCDSLLGVFLDQPGIHACTCVTGVIDCAVHEHTLCWGSGHPPKSLLCQSHRRMDVSLPDLCIFITH